MTERHDLALLNECGENLIRSRLPSLLLQTLAYRATIILAFHHVFIAFYQRPVSIRRCTR